MVQTKALRAMVVQAEVAMAEILQAQAHMQQQEVLEPQILVAAVEEMQAIQVEVALVVTVDLDMLWW